MTELHALLVEDNPGDARLIKETLKDVHRRHVRLTWVEGLTDAYKLVRAGDVDVVLLDLGLAESQGLDTLRRFLGECSSVPVVVLTGDTDVERSIEAVQQGAQDYISKDQLEPSILTRSIHYAVERHSNNLRIEHLNAVLRSIRNVNRLITQVSRTDELIQRACELLVETRGWPGAWVVLLGEEGELLECASSGICDAFEKIPSGIEGGHFPYCMSKGMSEPGIVVVSDTRAQCHDCPISASHSERGGFGRRLEMDGKVFGFMGVSVPSAFSVNEEETDLFEDMTNDISFAIHQMSLREERDAMRVHLAQSDRMATMGMLSAGVAHEINNPLTYMLYHMDILQEELPHVRKALETAYTSLVKEVGEERARALLEGQQEVLESGALDDIVESAKWARDGAIRVSGIVKDLKTFSRVEDQEPEPIRLTEVIESTMNMVTNEVKYRARVVRQLDEVPLVLANAGRLSQVFLNLVINAAQAIDEGKVEQNQIVVRTFTEGHDVCVEVRDTGKGISSEDMDKLFDPFFTTKPVGVGTGLGLSICKSIVDTHNGRIEVESEVGVGTRFVVRLPRYVDTKRKHDRTTRVSVTPPTRRGQILVVDDEEQILNALARMLRRDHDVVTLCSGAEAQALLSGNEHFDVILCDMMMPDVSGVDLYSWLEENKPHLAPQVIFMTGGVFTPQALEFKNRVENPIVTKPFDVKMLRLIIRELVERAAGDDRHVRKLK